MSKQPNIDSSSFFSDQTPWDIRKQILDYHISECMSDVERAKYLGLPEGCRIRERAKILSPEKLQIGNNCWIGEGAILDASGGLTIGNNVSIGLNVFIWTHDSFILNYRGKNTKEHSNKIKRIPTKIGNNSFIAGPSVIMPGVTIGEKCVVSPMSVVYNDIPDKTLYKPYREFYDLKETNKKLTEDVEALRVQINQLHEKLEWITRH